MQLRANDRLELLVSQERSMGQITVERAEGDLIFGKLAPEPAFSAVEPLFREYEEAVDHQSLSLVDELDLRIARLGLQVVSSHTAERVEIRDTQIWSDGSITFRFRDRHQPNQLADAASGKGSR